MYVDPAYADSDLDEVHRLIEASRFATLITAEPSLRVAHMPLQLRRGAGGDELVGHVPAADPLAESIRAGAELMACFLGPSVYVSPAWYADRGLPTYNFVAIQLLGTAQPMDDPRLVTAHLMSLVADHERPRSEPWHVDAWARERTAELLPELQAFTMPITSIKTKTKVSQNRTPGDRVGVMQALREAGEPAELAIEALMRDRFDENGEPQ